MFGYVVLDATARTTLSHPAPTWGSARCTRPLDAKDGGEHIAHSAGARCEELNDLIIERGRADRAEAQRVRCQVQPGAVERALQLRQLVAAVAVAFQDWGEVGLIVRVDVRRAGVL